MTRTSPDVVRVLHLSDIHCGHPFVAEHVEAAERLAREQRWNAIVISGDFAQRARVHEFEAARVILERLRAIAPTLVVPGNHDTAWWHAPFGYGEWTRMHARYREYISESLEPTVRVPGITMVGLNSSMGTTPQTLTWYPRDWRVKGGLADAQLVDVRQRLAASPDGDLRIVVVHHNVLRGRLSHRWGMKRPEHVLDRLAEAAPHVVCTGHDHEERVEVVKRAGGRFIVSGANTLSNRMRGHRPSALNVIEADATSVTVRAWGYENGEFVAGPVSATMSR
jgi:3',5'-cyclic AMP phosphodiesterase CpdA